MATMPVSPFFPCLFANHQSFFSQSPSLGVLPTLTGKLKTFKCTAAREFNCIFVSAREGKKWCVQCKPWEAMINCSELQKGAICDVAKVELTCPTRDDHQALHTQVTVSTWLCSGFVSGTESQQKRARDSKYSCCLYCPTRSLSPPLFSSLSPFPMMQMFPLEIPLN